MQQLIHRIALIACLATPTAPAVTQEKLHERYRAKVEQRWFTHGNWSDDYDAVRAKAKKERKLILALFTRSYAP